MTINRKTILKGLTFWLAPLAMVLVGTSFARAEYPEKPITLIATHSAGGGIDTFARTVASTMHEVIGQPMVVINRTGAAGSIAARATLDRDPDGYTLLLANMASLIAKSMMDGEKAKVDPIADLESMGGVGQLVTGLFVPMDSPFKTAGDLVSYAKENPGKLRWAHTGRGSFHMVAGAAFLRALDIKAKDIPFKGGSKVRTALVGDQIPSGFIGVHLLTGFEDKIRALGVTAVKRDPIMSEVPTLAELGLGSVDIFGPVAILGSPNIPADVKAKLVAAIKTVVDGDFYTKTTKKAGLAGYYTDPATSAKRMKQLKADFQPVIDDIKAQK